MQLAFALQIIIPDSKFSLIINHLDIISWNLVADSDDYHVDVSAYQNDIFLGSQRFSELFNSFCCCNTPLISLGKSGAVNAEYLQHRFQVANRDPFRQ